MTQELKNRKCRILSCDEKTGDFWIEDLENGETFLIDLFVDGSFNGVSGDFPDDKMYELRQKLVGSEVSIGMIFPVNCTTVYAANDVTVIENGFPFKEIVESMKQTIANKSTTFDTVSAR